MGEVKKKKKKKMEEKSKKTTLFQLIKFAVVGAANTLLDWGVLLGLMKATGITKGTGYSIEKGLSFTIAVINSYIFNKYWTFKAKEGKVVAEFSQFLAVSIVGMLINVGVATAVVRFIKPMDFVINFTQRIAEFIPLIEVTPGEIWGIFGAGVATLVALAWNFLGYKFVVFKK